MLDAWDMWSSAGFFLFYPSPMTLHGFEKRAQSAEEVVRTDTASLKGLRGSGRIPGGE